MPSPILTGARVKTSWKYIKYTLNVIVRTPECIFVNFRVFVNTICFGTQPFVKWGPVDTKNNREGIGNRLNP